MANNLEFEAEKHALCMFVQRWVPQYNKIVKAIDVEYLQADAYKWYIKRFQEYLKQYDSVIPWEYVDVLIRREFEGDAQAEMRKAIYILYSLPITWGDAAIREFREYLAWRVYSSGVTAVQQGFKKSRSMTLALGHGQQAINKASSLLQDIQVHDLVDDFETRAAQWLHEAQNPNLKSQLLLGIPDLDAQLKLVEGTVNSFLAPLKRYKSYCLGHVGLCALAMGYNVVHVTYENSVDLAEDRFFSRLSHIPQDTLTKMRADPSKFSQAREFINGLKSSLANRLKIIKAKPKKTTVAEVSDILEVLKHEEGFVPDVAVWDYANLIAPSKDFKGQRDLAQEQVVWDLQEYARDERGLGAHPKIVMTAIQSNRDGIKKESLDEGDTGQSIGIPQALDSMICINQNRQERIDRVIRFEVKVSRNCEIKEQVSVTSDISWGCISVENYAFISDRLSGLFYRAVA